MATVTCDYPYAVDERKFARISQVARGVTNIPNLQPTWTLRGDRVFVTIGGLGSTEAIQIRLALANDHVNVKCSED
ncbi:hypothetical protein BC1002_7142 (plasmid) [Paraburkholderia atlantica]|uniref:Uncharacterized protein n=1 Tax=Paraburkholderia atlantica TaxID=2654982 RepID=D5WNK9_PARAM|nr:hypothetical protein BC1002_7142 [Paraburkholderia atlantica]